MQEKRKMHSESVIHRFHPWHGLSLGNQAPNTVNCYIEIVPTDTIKYELDKETGLLKVDRPQKYSSLCPTLYGLLPRTYCGQRVAEYCMKKTGLKNIVGDGDPMDICVLTENRIPRGDIMLQAIPIGGFRLIDNGEADDKIIGVLVDDFVYGDLKDITECHHGLVERLRHYFLTYKDYPNKQNSAVTITHIYNSEEAREIINLSCQDYHDLYPTQALR